MGEGKGGGIEISIACAYNVATMKTRIVPLGNSQGIRIPKLILEEAAMPEDVELEVVGDTIVIRPARKPREGWFDNIVVEPLNDEDLEWQNAPLSVESDKEWVWEGDDGSDSDRQDSRY